MHLPAEISAMLLVGDETALPAIGRFFDERPVQAPAHAVITVSEDAARQELALREGDSVTWVRKERPDGPGLLRAVREAFAGLELGPDPFLWAAGEVRSLLPLRRWASRERAIPKTHQSVTGYWHVAMDSSGRAADAAQSASGTGTDGPRGGRGPAAPTTLPVAPVAWFAVAAAVQTGLLDALADAEEAESAQGPEASPEPEASQGVQNTPGLEGAQGLEAAQIAEAAGLDAALLLPLLDLLAREGAAHPTGLPRHLRTRDRDLRLRRCRDRNPQPPDVRGLRCRRPGRGRPGIRGAQGSGCHPVVPDRAGPGAGGR
ncbi:siderophore-interacting protein [Rothia kristinae]|uniref:siderophore-interacting protein n=1 Tax=Rothia kristinae TaxID=37923 RepID=UPI001CD65888|nr:siderophore-interacting protein [Rothia kristinae]MCA1168891.1 siderophore-interacting protein [Rothia kristinae]